MPASDACLQASGLFSLGVTRIALHNAELITTVFRTEHDHLPLCEIPGLQDQLRILVRAVATAPARFTAAEPHPDSELRMASNLLANQPDHLEKLQLMAISKAASPTVQQLARDILLGLPTSTESEFKPAFNSFINDAGVGFVTPDMDRFQQLYRLLTVLQLLRPTSQRFQAQELQAFRQAVVNTDFAAALGQLLAVTPEELACVQVHEYSTLARLLDAALHTLAFLNAQAHEAGLPHPKGLPPAQFMAQLVGLLKMAATGKLGGALAPEVGCQGRTSVTGIVLGKALLWFHSDSFFYPCSNVPATISWRLWPCTTCSS